MPDGHDRRCCSFPRRPSRPGLPDVRPDPARAAVLVEVPILGRSPRSPVSVPVPTDGVRVDLLPDAFARSGARLLYLQPPTPTRPE